MTTRVGTARYKTRHIMRVAKKDKGKLALSRFLQNLKEGDQVVLKAVPSIHQGMYHRRFHGKTGTVKRMVGKNCEIAFKDKNNWKTIMANPVHLVKVKNGTKNT